MITLLILYWMASQHTALGAVPNEMELQMTRTMGEPNISLGEVSQLTITIDFPIGKTNSVVIEVISSIETTSLSFVKMVNSNVGSNIILDTEKKVILNNPIVYPGIEYPAVAKVRYNTRAIFDLGTVTNTGLSSDLNASQICLAYEVIMILESDINNEAPYWAGAGVAIKSMQYVWINQVGYMYKRRKGTPVYSTIQCNIQDEPTNLKPGEIAKFYFNMSISYPKFRLVIEAEWLNATVPDCSVLKMQAVYAGKSFKYFLDLNNTAANNFLCKQISFLALEIPDLIKKDTTLSGSHEDNDTISVSDSDEESDTIIVEVTIQNTLDIDLQGTELLFECRAKISNKETCLDRFTVVVDPPRNTNSGAPALVAEALGTNLVSPGFPAVVMASIQTPPGTSHMYEINVTSSTTSDNDPALYVLALTPIASDTNQSCSHLNVKAVDSFVYPSVPPTVTSKTFIFTVFNFGNLTSTPNTVNFTVVSRLMDRMDVSQNDTQVVTIRAKSFGGTDSATVSVTFSVGMRKMYPNSVRHKFQILSECEDNNFLQNRITSVQIIVYTEEGVVSGPLVFQFPIPQSNTSSIIYFRKAKVVEAGKNVFCVGPDDPLQVIVTTWEESSDGIGGNVTVPVICNINLSSDPLANRFALKVEIEIIGNESDQSRSYKDYIGYRAIYSDTEIWVGHLDIEVYQPTFFSDMTVITGILVNQSDWFSVISRGRYILEYSVDGTTFTDAPNLIDFGTTKLIDGQTYIEYSLSVPIISKYAQLRATPNKGGCWVNNYFVTKPAASVLKIWGDVNDTLMFELNKVIDRNPATCFVPLVNGVDTHPPMLWIIINLSFFNLTLGSPYKVEVTGENLSCDRRSRPKSMHVAYSQELKSSLDFEGYITFCTLSGNESPTRCIFNCLCTNPVSCDKTFLYMRNDGDTINPARFCGFHITLA